MGGRQRQKADKSAPATEWEGGNGRNTDKSAGLVPLGGMAEIKGKNTFEWAAKARMAEIKGKNTFE
ncbi:hypothetical protein AML91_21980 [Paenibacillus jilunlii]|uniref:Uncharacterized protein n=1 Tax=Paenibacillus jilunlii TaxID=682956 RepID=A0ABR5SPF8_9BACL|nr:hypothetical protein AML91_21980 [Paenibacillus jilunlii]